MLYKKFDSSKHDLNVGDSVKIGKKIGTVKNYKWPSRVLVELPLSAKEARETGCYAEQGWYSTQDIKVR